MHRTGRALTLSLGLALGPAGCAGGGAPAAPPALTGSPAVSQAQSLQIIDTYSARYSTAVTRDRVATWLSLTTGVLGPITRADVRESGGRVPSGPAIALTNPVLYVPRLTGSPRWFAVAALQRQGKATTPVFLVFTYAAAGGWRAAFGIFFHGRPPQVAVDSDGYAEAVDGGAGLALAPAALPAAQATALAGGTGAALAPGPFTTQPSAADRVGHWAAAPGPVYALRTPDGGALVFYAITRTVTSRSEPPPVRAYLNGRTDAAITTTWTYPGVAYIPARGRTEVIFQTADLTSATTG